MFFILNPNKDEALGEKAHPATLQHKQNIACTRTITITGTSCKLKFPHVALNSFFMILSSGFSTFPRASLLLNKVGITENGERWKIKYDCSISHILRSKSFFGTFHQDFY